MKANYHKIIEEQKAAAQNQENKTVDDVRIATNEVLQIPEEPVASENHVSTENESVDVKKEEPNNDEIKVDKNNQNESNFQELKGIDFDYVGRVNASVGKLNVRKTPEVKGEVVRLLDNNSKIDYNPFNEDWVEVDDGYVMKKFITEE